MTGRSTETVHVMAKQATVATQWEDHERVNTHHKGYAGDHSNFCDFTHEDKIASKMADCETIWFTSPEFTKRVNMGYKFLNLIHKAIAIRRRRGLRPIVAPAGSTLSTDSHAGHQVAS